jgi:hypothetical protein
MSRTPSLSSRRATLQHPKQLLKLSELSPFYLAARLCQPCSTRAGPVARSRVVLRSRAGRGQEPARDPDIAGPAPCADRAPCVCRTPSRSSRRATLRHPKQLLELNCQEAAPSGSFLPCQAVPAVLHVSRGLITHSRRSLHLEHTLASARSQPRKYEVRRPKRIKH